MESAFDWNIEQYIYFGGCPGNNAGMGVFNEKFHPHKMLLVGTGGIPYEEFLNINPKELF